MKFEDLNKIFQAFLKEIIIKNPDKYNNSENLESDLGILYDKFENTKIASLGGITPKNYVQKLVIENTLFDYVLYCLENNLEISDIVLDEVVRAKDAVEFLNGLIYEKNNVAKMLGVSLLTEISGEEVDDIMINILTNDQLGDEIKTVAYEYLLEGNEKIADKILNIINSVPDTNQGILVEVLSNYKGKKEVFYWLVTMLQRAEDVPLYVTLLGRYGDPAAIDILKSFAMENDINYIDFVEIRSAVEELGGEFELEKDFSDDPYFKYMNHIENNDSDETPNR